VSGPVFGSGLDSGDGRLGLRRGRAGQRPGGRGRRCGEKASAIHDFQSDDSELNRNLGGGLNHGADKRPSIVTAGARIHMKQRPSAEFRITFEICECPDMNRPGCDDGVRSRPAGRNCRDALRYESRKFRRPRNSRRAPPADRRKVQHRQIFYHVFSIAPPARPEPVSDSRQRPLAGGEMVLLREYTIEDKDEERCILHRVQSRVIQFRCSNRARARFCSLPF
jgi:hypothetical protein